MSNDTPNLHSASEESNLQTAHAYDSDGQDVTSFPATDNRGTGFEDSTAGERPTIQTAVDGAVGSDSPVTTITQRQGVHRTPFPQASPGLVVTEETATDANTANPTQTMMGSNTSQLVPVSHGSTVTESGLHPHLHRNVMDHNANPISFPQAPPGPIDAEENANIHNPVETTMDFDTFHLDPVSHGGATTELDRHPRLHNDVMIQHVPPTSFPQAPPDPIDSEENATGANIPNSTETTTDSHPFHLVPVSHGGSTTELDRHPRLHRDVMIQHVHPTSASPHPINTEQSTTDAGISIEAETMIGSNTSQLVPIGGGTMSNEPGFHSRLRHDLMDQQARRAPIPQLSSRPTDTGTAADTGVPAPMETMMGISSASISHRRTISESKPHPLGLRRDNTAQHARRSFFPQTSLGPNDVEENAPGTEMPAMIETDLGSNTSRLGSASRGSGLGSVGRDSRLGSAGRTSRLGSAGDIHNTALSQAPRQSIDVERNAPVDAAIDPLSFSIYITPQCITPQIQWEVSKVKEKNWMQHYIPFLVHSPSAVRDRNSFDDLLEITEQYSSFFISGKEIYGFILMRNNEAPIILTPKNFLLTLGAGANAEIRAVMREKTIISRKVIHSFRGVKAIFALIAVFITIIAGVFKLYESVTATPKITPPAETSTRTVTETVIHYTLFPQWDIE